MDKTCKYNATCGMDFCQPWQDSVECPYYRRKEKPILFNTDMVKAILENRKTAARRLVFQQPEGVLYRLPNSSCWPGYFADSTTARVCKPRYQPGDVLYVRETWGNYSVDNPESNAAYYLYRADYSDDAKGYWYEPEHIHFCDFPRWRPSIHMPKDAARIFLRIKSVRAERLKAIDAEQAKAEGICSVSLGDGTVGYSVGLWDKTTYEGAVGAFAKLWDSTIKPADRDRYGWDANPWVWVFDFERISEKERMGEQK